MIKKRLTERMKRIASCCDPYYDGFATEREVKTAYKMVSGHYWKDEDWQQFVSFSPNGTRSFFEYGMWNPATKKLEKAWTKSAKKAAKLWAEGKFKASSKANDETWKMGRGKS